MGQVSSQRLASPEGARPRGTSTGLYPHTTAPWYHSLAKWHLPDHRTSTVFYASSNWEYFFLIFKREST
jgi:hypothetical protein